MRGRGRGRGRSAVAVAAGLMGGFAGVHAAAGVDPWAEAMSERAAEGTGGDRIVLRTAGIAIGDVHIGGIHGGRVWFERDGRERGSVPLAAVADVAFAAAPELAAAERRAQAGDRRGAAAMLRRAVAIDGAAGSWAARRVIAWLADDDPAAAIRLAGERLIRDGSIQWVARLRAATGALRAGDPRAAGASGVEATRATLRQVRRWRRDLDVVGRGAMAIDAEPEVRRGLVELEGMSERLLAVVRARGPLSDDARGARDVRDRVAGVDGSKAAGTGDVLDVADVAVALRAGRVDAVLAAMQAAGGPDVSNFPPALLAELASAAEAAGRPVMAAAAWLRCGVLHPNSPEAGLAWGSAARLHEDALGDAAAARRIREHARALADASGESRG